MCGIYGVIATVAQQHNGATDPFAQVKRTHKALRHRGPDWEGELVIDNVGCKNHLKPRVYLAHHRLSIIDPAGGSQPIVWPGCGALCVNGEIYNYRALKEAYPADYKTESDCEVILAGWNQDNIKRDPSVLLAKLSGIFAFMLVDTATGSVLIARDPIGVIPLYYGYDSQGWLHVASEMKAFPHDVVPHHFPPGHYMLVNLDQFGVAENAIELVRYYTDLDLALTTRQASMDTIPAGLIEHYKLTVRETLCRAVEQQLMADVPFGALLSGGLDSSLVCSIIVKALQKPSIRQTTNLTWDGQLRTFSIGLEGSNSSDLAMAARAAKWLGTKHYNFTFTMDEGLAAIRDVIWHLETYDVTTIRASTPMYLLARKIKSMGIKMVLSGEGSDEIFGGYLYFLNAPDDEQHTMECARRVGQLSMFDCLRANKSTMAWGLEARPPFLDTELVKLGLTMPACLKRHKGIEKWILREAFNVIDPATNSQAYLPDDLLWRQKEQFSDGVGYGWIDRLRAEAESRVSSYILSLAPERYPVNTPKTKEEYYYRTIFDELFPARGAEYTVQKWIPRTDWPGVGYDPSGRAQAVHIAKYV
jgi:asparagine synthase (glutamine-hydrolysing)